MVTLDDETRGALRMGGLRKRLPAARAGKRNLGRDSEESLMQSAALVLAALRECARRDLPPERLYR